MTEATSHRVVRLLPWGMLLTGLAATFASVHFAWQADPYRPPRQRLDSADIAWALSFFVFPIVGAVIATKRPRLSLGWILCSFGPLLGLGLLGIEYATYVAVTEESSAPATGLVAVGAGALAWIATWAFTGMIGLAVFLLLLFPTGRVPSPAWRIVAWFAGTAALVACTANAFKPGAVDAAGEVSNPLGVEPLAPLLSRVAGVSNSALIVCLFLSALAPLLRFRRAGGVERQQIKWFASAALLFAVSTLMNLVLSQVGIDPDVEDFLGTATFIVTNLAVAGAIGFSLLRYRLYDVDVVINRTLVYLGLTATLAAVYVGMIVLLQSILPMTADSDVSVAASTLAVAALFRPARLRFQKLIDRRFYRSRYDASLTLQEFAVRVRNEVGLNAVTDELLGVVHKTLIPTTASLWLRDRPAGEQWGKPS